MLGHRIWHRLVAKDRVQWLMRSSAFASTRVQNRQPHGVADIEGMCEQHMRDISSRDEDLQQPRSSVAREQCGR